MRMTGTDYTIDTAKILKGKFGEKTPKWLIWLVRKLLHEDWLNTYFREGYTGIDFTENAFKYLNVSLQVEGLEKVPKDGYYTVASNHPLGGNDALAIVTIFGRHFDGKVRIMVNDFLMALKQLDGYFVAVNKVGGQSRDLIAQTDALFSGDTQVLMFPAGKASRKIDGKIQDTPWNKTFITKSVQFHRDIIPMHFYGRNSWRFYFVDWIGKVTGINKKFPLAMILLVDELYRSRGKTYKVVIGEPIPLQTFDNSRRPQEWAEWMRQEVYKL